MVTVGEHPNVLSLIRACTKTGNVWLILIDVLRAVSFSVLSFYTIANSQLCNTNKCDFASQI